MSRGCVSCLARLLSVLLVFAVAAIGGSLYYRAFPSMHIPLFVCLVALAPVALFCLTRRPRGEEQPFVSRCNVCFQESPHLEWCVWTDQAGQYHSWLCRDCQNHFHAAPKS